MVLKSSCILKHREVVMKLCCCLKPITQSEKSSRVHPAVCWAPAGQTEAAQEKLEARKVMVYSDRSSRDSKMEGVETETSPTSMETKAKPITVLHPFTHQVGGHTQMMLLDHSTLCKPLIQRELHFYLNTPDDMKEFTPKYKGVVEVRRIDSGPILYHPIKGYKGKKDEGHDGKKTAELRVQVYSCDEEGLEKEMIAKLWKDGYSRPSSRYFLLLENVASNFHRPCILDLKMGTRQHGDDAPAEKRSRQMAKCAASTSASLGMRLCGMQVFQENLGAYLWKDKYYGRTLDEKGVRRALYQFFHNGFHLRLGLVEKVLMRLCKLRKAIEKQNTFRFYSSSLLILYEGCEEEEFETQMSGDHDDDLTTGSFCINIGDDSDMHTNSISCSDDESSLEASTDSASSDIDWTSDKKKSGYFNKDRDWLSENKKKCKQLVDVRMIDFAHTTFEGFDGDTHIHKGPDNGYLLGLDNLIRLLKEVKAKNSDECKI